MQREYLSSKASKFCDGTEINVKWYLGLKQNIRCLAWSSCSIMRNLDLPAEALRALRFITCDGVGVSWVDGKVEFRSNVPPSDRIVTLIDKHEKVIARLMRPNGDGQSPLDLARKRHQPFLRSIEAARPPDLRGADWQAAIDGLWVFLAAGHGAEAERLSWPRDELYAVPPLWCRVDLCGAALLIGDREVVGITSSEIRIKTPSGATLAFYRKPAVDYGLAYRARIKQLGDDGHKEEFQLRALEAVVNLYRSHHPSADVDTAKAAVLAAIKQAAP